MDSGTMSERLAIVQADELHLDAAWAVIDRCRAALRQRGILQWDDVYPTRATVAADIAHRRLYVLSVSDECQATVALDDTQDPLYRTVPWTTAEPALVVHRLCVDPPAQGRGYGAELMKFAETYAERHRYSSIRLDAYSDNPSAVELYRRRGYREAGQVMFPRRALPFHLFELAVGRHPGRNANILSSDS
jgi:ribosomal protein S18 acetylase RimI-like enzyme